MIRKENKSMINSPSPKSWKGFMQEIPPLSDDFSVEGAELPDDTRNVKEVSRVRGIRINDGMGNR